MTAPSIIRKRVHLIGSHRDGFPIDRCNGDFDEVFLLVPGTGTYFLVSRERVIEQPAPATNEGNRGLPS